MPRFGHPINNIETRIIQSNWIWSIFQNMFCSVTIFERIYALCRSTSAFASDRCMWIEKWFRFAEYLVRKRTKEERQMSRQDGENAANSIMRNKFQNSTLEIRRRSIFSGWRKIITNIRIVLQPICFCVVIVIAIRALNGIRSALSRAIITTRKYLKNGRRPPSDGWMHFCCHRSVGAIPS